MTYDKNNIFAKIIRGEISCNKVFEDDEILAFEDISKAAPIHVLVIPKGEYKDFAEFNEKSGAVNIAHFFSSIAKIAKKLGLEEEGYRIISNLGKNANQTVSHFHIHILGGENLGPLISSDKLMR
jgi:diadenosine tetraphosphate (Ap4A) HIT family hydrolase